MRIMVLTLFSGEKELELCKDSLKAQTLAPIEHVVFSWLSNVEAHATLYRRIMQERDNFDLFIKLDADMVLSRETALAEVARYFSERPGLDHLEVKVHDHYSGALISGVHIFSKRVHWNVDTHDPLFVDPRPDFPGDSVFDPQDLEPFVDHAPDPGAYQAFHFGYHRALKAFQPGRSEKRLAWTEAQLTTLDGLRRRFEETGSHNLGLAVLAADMVERGMLEGTTGDRQSSAVEEAFNRVKDISSDELLQKLEQNRVYWRLRRTAWLTNLRLRDFVARKAKRLQRLRQRNTA